MLLCLKWPRATSPQSSALDYRPVKNQNLRGENHITSKYMNNVTFALKYISGLNKSIPTLF